jgi:hypothetical protein
MTNNRIRLWLVAAGLVVLPSMSALAMSGTTQVAWRGKPVAVQPGWPAGVLKLVNDPLRTDGWNPWFSEWPNDVNYYAYEVGGTNDVNELIAKLAAIKTAKPQVLLRPGKEARALAFTTVLKEGNGTAVVFSIGSQERINQWYERLEEVEPGVRKFGVARYREVPQAHPPTLTLYAGHPAIDLKSLRIPPSVEVSAVVSAADRADAQNAAAVKAIDDFLAQHRTTSGNPAQLQPSK